MCLQNPFFLTEDKINKLNPGLRLRLTVLTWSISFYFSVVKASDNKIGMIVGLLSVGFTRERKRAKEKEQKGGILTVG